MFVARTAHRLPAGWNLLSNISHLPSNISHLIDFIDAKNRDLTLPLRGFFSMFVARQRTAYRRGGISYQTSHNRLLLFRIMSLISGGVDDRETELPGFALQGA